MALDLYEPCSCGSGKKFKWCCQPIFATINRAWEQEMAGQHEAALRLMDEAVREHEGNPEAWGQKARLLFSQGKGEEAEKTLQKAFDLNPNYPAGLLLSALIRFQEGETAGALLLARRAAEAYHPDARPHLAEVYLLIFECEMRMNRPVAARAALRLAQRFAPGEEEINKAFETQFGAEGRLPNVARREYTFKKSSASYASSSLDTPRLGDLVRIFETLTSTPAQGGERGIDAAAWFNLGLVHAWLGNNSAALEAFGRYVELETDENTAGEAAALMEVLRCGQGLEEEGDYREHVFTYRFRDPQPIVHLLQEWERGRRLVPLQAPQEGVFMAMMLELNTAGLLTVGAPPSDAGRLAGYVVILGDLFQFTSPLQEPFERLREEVRQRLSLGLTELQERRVAMQFQHVMAEALLFPFKGSEGDVQERMRMHMQKHYEEIWIHKPRRALSGNTPIDAAAHPILRKHLRGVIQFIQDCCKVSPFVNYDFDRLRRKLGLIRPEQQIQSPETASSEHSAQDLTRDIASMGTAELAGLNAGNLSDEQLEQAYQAAVKLDAEELAANFARQLIARPMRPERMDRFPWYSYLAEYALRSGDMEAALDYINAGEKADCEHNEGRRRNDYELRRGQIHTKRGEVEQAAEVFQRLIERVPNNFRYRGSAAESMLSLHQPAQALRFAEEGLAAARQANDRDSEQYLLELATAAKKQIG